ncbi:murein biosynthesis integral membrane protein MurJ [Chungangia koreensis]|uniref:Murein biosynthesis integral membrane protein MurJ n=1 Tax=Chungangia koreensis TaxID=752657 RepID=A0ABV8X274_9LACT
MASLKKAALWTTALALLLKLSGFIRESVIAKQFGISAETDGYNLAFGFITLVVAMIATGFNNVFLPMYVKRRTEGAGDSNANALLNWTMILFAMISVVGWIFAEAFVPFIYGNMSAEVEVIAVNITQIFFAFMTMIALSGLLESYLQSRRIFVPSQLAKLLATLFSALFALFFSDIWGIYAVANGFVFGTVVGALIQTFYLIRSDYHWRPDTKMESDFRKAFIVLIIPSLLNSVVGQVNLFVNRYFASGIGDGPVTILSYSSLITSIPTAIYGTTLAAIIFTLMSEQVDKLDEFKGTFFRGMELSFVTLLPIAVGLGIVGDAVIEFIYERGAFTATDTQLVYVALLLYLPIIVFQGMQLMLSKSMYARGKTAVVFRISVTTIVVNYIMNWLFVDDFGYPALALSASVVSIYYFTVSMIVVYKDLGMSEFKRFMRMSGRVVVPAIAMGLVVWGAKVLAGASTWYPLVELAVLVPLGMIVYAVVLKVAYPVGFNRLLRMVKRG